MARLAALSLGVILNVFLCGAMVTVSHADEAKAPALFKIATDLARQYDANYAAKNPDGMAQIYAEDAVLVSPSGKIIRGSTALKNYYTARFAAGAKDHALKITEVHVQGDGGYGLGTFAVTVHTPAGQERREAGHIVTIYKHTDDGWHLALVIPSASPGK